MEKKLLSLLLAALLLVGLLPAASAKAEDVPQAEKALVLRELEIMVGDQNGDLQLDRAVTRAEFTKLLIAASPYKDNAADPATAPYPDVSYRSWYAPYVRAAVDARLVQGDLEGYFRPDRTITLGEGATMLVRLLGYTDADFAAQRWPAGQMALCRSLKLNAGVTASRDTDLLTRKDCLHLFYNLLTVSTRSGAPYITLLGHTLDRNGDVDLTTLLSIEREGPILLTGSWQDLLPFDSSDALVYRDEKRASLDQLQEWDLLYWAKGRPILYAVSQGALGQLSAQIKGPLVVEDPDRWADALPFSPDDALAVYRNGRPASGAAAGLWDLVYWAENTRTLYFYTQRVQGAVESVSPSPASPSAVTVAGRTYALETLAAQYAFSDLGAFRKGDAVTLLLGRGGGVAAVKDLEDGSASRIGILTALTSTVYTDAADQPYTAKSLILTAADGLTYTYPYDWTDTRLAVGDLIQVTQDGSTVTAARFSSPALSGVVHADALRLSGMDLSPDVAILDTFGDSGLLSVPLTRLDGVKLTDAMVRAYVTDNTGAITALILRDATGDLHTYGVLTDIRNVSVASLLQGTYTYLSGGLEQMVTVSGTLYYLNKGPLQIRMDGRQVSKLSNLTPLPNVTLSGRTAVSGGRTAILSDQVQFYLCDGDVYTPATRDQLTGGSYALTAWYDKPDNEGGRVRIVTGQPR